MIEVVFTFEVEKEKKEPLRKTFADTNLETVLGHVKLKPDNTATTPSGGQQWVKGKRFPYDAKLVSAGNWKDTLRPEGRVLPLQEFRKG